ncbi:MAG: hypothetical protein ACLFVU_12590 [Phycisphaerae bacterium]
MNAKRLTLWMVSVVLLAAGCNNTPTAANSPGEISELSRQARPPVSDVPVPRGFSLDESRSRSFASGGLRYLDHRYTGGEDKFAVARFFKKQMPVFRWARVTDMFVQGDIILDFEKDSERCRVVISDGGWTTSTVVKMQLWTSGRIEARSTVRTGNQ